jgi:predicted Co/Zn/Cd cation transporter (cation efflux family)
MQLTSLLTPVVLLLVLLLLCVYFTAIAEVARLLDVTRDIAMTIAMIANTVVVVVFVCIDQRYYHPL